MSGGENEGWNGKKSGWGRLGLLGGGRKKRSETKDASDVIDTCDVTSSASVTSRKRRKAG